MFTRKRLLPLVVLALGLSFSVSTSALAAPPAPGKIDASVKSPQVFRYKHKAGEINRYSSTIGQEVSMKSADGGAPFGGQDVKTSMTSLLRMETRKVLPNGDAQVLTTYEDFDMSMQQGGQTIKGAQLGPIAEMVKKIKTTTVLAPNGQQKSVNFEGLPNEMRQLQDSFKSALIGATPEFPAKGLKIGEGWTQSMPMSLQQGTIQIKMDFKIKYTFLGFTEVDKLKVAVFKTDLDMTIARSTSEMMGVSMTIGGNGKGTGFLYFDNTAGRVHKSDMEMFQDIDMGIQGPEGPQSMKMKPKTTAGMALKGDR